LGGKGNVVEQDLQEKKGRKAAEPINLYSGGRSFPGGKRRGVLIVTPTRGKRLALRKREPKVHGKSGTPLNKGRGGGDTSIPRKRINREKRQEDYSHLEMARNIRGSFRK